ncbi:helix-turn-helix domain-containing protein [Pseudomonadales bacterium]|nr:helix-turn-helix domain-containing protein [Pseudomonadales bacterium]
MSKARKKFGSQIREFRQARGYTQEELAAIAGLHRTYIGSVERGERNISFDCILSLAKALDRYPSDLFTCLDQ